MADRPAPSGGGIDASWEEASGQRVERDRRLLAAIVDAAVQSMEASRLALVRLPAQR